MFGITTYEQLPAEYITSYAKWYTYMATVWTALLTNQRIAAGMTVVEIAPGASTVIGLALKACQFKGKLYVVEPVESLLVATCNNYKMLLPCAEIYPLHHTLLSSIDSLPRHVDFILSNHPLDDMLLAYPFDESCLHALFNLTGLSSAEISSTYHDQWLKISADLNGLHVAKKQVLEQWMHVLQELTTATLIMSQYPSVALENNNLNALNQHAMDMLCTLRTYFFHSEVSSQDKLVQSTLNTLENFNNKHIATEVLNAKNWLVYPR